jgi:RNA polymerase sigma-70 factor (ECF subfamily)
MSHSADWGRASGSEIPNSTSTSLLERVKAQDAEAWRRLIRLYGRLVLYWCRQAGLQHADRSDVFQEVVRAVVRHISSFQRGRPGGTFRGWLRSITRTKICDHFRRQRREPPAAGGSDVHRWLQGFPEGDGDSGEDEAGSHPESVILVNEALSLIQAEFQERTWRAFWRTAADGLSTDAVAEELGMTPAGVRKAKSRVLGRLRQELEGFME